MAVESTTSALNAYQSGSSLSPRVEANSRERDDSKAKYEDPIVKKLSNEESSPLTDGSEVMLLGAQASGNSNTASKAASAYETAAKTTQGSDGENGGETAEKPLIGSGEAKNDVPAYVKAAREIIEAQERRAEDSKEKRTETESRVMRILDDRQRSGEITV